MKDLMYKNQRIAFDDSELAYNLIYNNFKQITLSLIDAYEKEYHALNGHKAFIDKGWDIATLQIEKALDETVNLLVQQKIYDISITRILEDYGNLIMSPCMDAYDEIYEQYFLLTANSKELEEYRNSRKQARFKLQGGGFGIAGAAKGIATAGVFNVTSGAIHGAVNFMGNVATNIKNAHKADAIYNNPATLLTLKKGLASSIFNIHYAYCNYLNIFIPQYDPDKVSGLLANINRIPKNEQLQVLFGCLKLDPYNFSIYKTILNLYGDEQQELVEIAALLGIDNELIKYKQSILTEMFYKANKMNSIHDIENEIDTIQSTMDYLGYSHPNFIKPLKEKIDQLDITARTLDGTIYATHELFNKAVKDKQYVENTFAKLPQNASLQELLTAKGNIESSCSTSNIVNPKINLLNQMISSKTEEENFKKELNDPKLYKSEDLLKIKRNQILYNKNYYEAFSSYLPAIEGAIVDCRYENFDFNLLTTENIELMKKTIHDVDCEFQHELNSRVITAMKDSIKVYEKKIKEEQDALELKQKEEKEELEIVKNKARLYKKHKLSTTILSILMTLGITLVISVIAILVLVPVLGDTLAAVVFLIILGIACLGIISMLWDMVKFILGFKIEGIPKNECKEAYKQCKKNNINF